MNTLKEPLQRKTSVYMNSQARAVVLRPLCLAMFQAPPVRTQWNTGHACAREQVGPCLTGRRPQYGVAVWNVKDPSFACPDKALRTYRRRAARSGDTEEHRADHPPQRMT